MQRAATIKSKVIIGSAVLLSALVAAPANAAQINSTFTKIDFKKCKMVESYEQGATHSCPGLRGYTLRVSEGDLRFAIGYGDNAKNQMSMTQFLAPFNTIGKTMQWQVSGGRPIATILRYFTDTGDGRKGQILVVTKLGKREACHMAYVDARANANANALAEGAASKARTFKCGRDQAQFIGKKGVSPF